MKRILILNNYSINRVRYEVKQKLKPSHHLFGISELDKAGYELVVIDPQQNGFWYHVGKIIAKIPLCNMGDLDIQIRALLAYKKYDIVYAPCQDVTVLLGVLSFFHLFRKPIIALAHHPILRGRLKLFKKYSLYPSIKGHKFFPALSNIVANQLNVIAGKKISMCLSWGPDLEYYNTQTEKISLNSCTKSKEYDFICIGRTGRDIITFVKAIMQTNYTGLVYCPSSYKQHFSYMPSKNVKIIYLEEEEPLNYQEIIALYKISTIIAIPLYEQDYLCGLNSLTDATGMGMPILITYNKYIETDIEKEQFGYWVKAGNTEDWINKIELIMNNKGLIKLMGKNSIQYAMKTANNQIYTNQLLCLIQRCS